MPPGLYYAGSGQPASQSMSVLSKLLPSHKRIADLSRVYASHRPLAQRGLTAGFVLYVLLAAYQGVVARPHKDVPARDGKPARVAVSLDMQFVIGDLTTIPGRCIILSASRCHP